MQLQAYAQVWFFDPEIANQFRVGRINTARNTKIDGPILGMLTDMMLHCNLLLQYIIQLGSNYRH